MGAGIRCGYDARLRNAGSATAWQGPGDKRAGIRDRFARDGAGRGRHSRVSRRRHWRGVGGTMQQTHGRDRRRRLDQPRDRITQRGEGDGKQLAQDLACLFGMMWHRGIPGCGQVLSRRFNPAAEVTRFFTAEGVFHRPRPSALLRIIEQHRAPCVALQQAQRTARQLQAADQRDQAMQHFPHQDSQQKHPMRSPK